MITTLVCESYKDIKSRVIFIHVSLASMFNIHWKIEITYLIFLHISPTFSTYIMFYILWFQFLNLTCKMLFKNSWFWHKKIIPHLYVRLRNCFIDTKVGLHGSLALLEEI